ncbi:TM2 domain-containing protein [Gordonia sp. DT30]|uniref:TM2 domain-containing protein n=1 Tax=unclassified Gordonia (in: high G+C Gram-positive bacteria) TaxID=2657482 RepID=UPI003CF9B5B3
MSYPQYPGNNGTPGQQPYGAAQAPGFGSQPGYGSQPYGAQPVPAPYPGYGSAPGYGSFNVDPVTGEPLSDKSKMTAGLLQLFLGGFAAGRFYLGDTKTAAIQLCANIGAWLLIIVGFIVIGVSAGGNSGGGAAFGVLIMLLGWLVALGVGIWILVDAIRMFTGSVRDPQGRKLRD